MEGVRTRERALSFGASGRSGDLNPDDGERAGDVIFTIISEVQVRKWRSIMLVKRREA